MNGIGKLEDRDLPPQEAFYSRLKNEDISDDDYARCQAVWRDNRTKSMRDFLMWYKNRDVVPFLEAIDKQFAFYKQQNIDMFKDGVSVPDWHCSIYSTNFRRTPSSLSSTRRTAICTYSSKTISSVVLPSYFTATMRRIRGEQTCRSILGCDTNALYTWALMQDMLAGWYTRRREEKQFRPQQAQPFGQMAVQWLTWESAKNGCAIRHQFNGSEKRVGKLPVDGWCAKTHTAYQFHGCFFHGCPKCYDQNETNSVNGKTMARLLEKTRCNTAYLRRHVKVVEMWYCEWKEVRNE